MRLIEGHATYSIYICDRVQLYINNKGFLFTNKLKSPKTLHDFLTWDNWKYHWQLYKRDNIEQKIYYFLDGHANHAKNQTWYQELKFEVV
jgi:hypothetical protein